MNEHLCFRLLLLWKRSKAAWEYRRNHMNYHSIGESAQITNFWNFLFPSQFTYKRIHSSQFAAKRYRSWAGPMVSPKFFWSSTRLGRLCFFAMLIFFVPKSKNLDAYVIVFWHQSVFKFRDFYLGVSEVRDILVALLVISNFSSLNFWSFSFVEILNLKLKNFMLCRFQSSRGRF